MSDKPRSSADRYLPWSVVESVRPLPEVTPACETCRFWNEDRSISLGYCKRHAPRPIVGWDGKGDHEVFWPTTEGSDWCGEYQRNEKVK